MHPKNFTVGRYSGGAKRNHLQEDRKDHEEETAGAWSHLFRSGPGLTRVYPGLAKKCDSPEGARDVENPHGVPVLVDPLLT
jgi:hypothetical protein